MTFRPAFAELFGTALLLYVVVGSGIAVERLAADATSALFFHAVSVGVGLATLIALFAETSGSHFNPAVTIAFWRRGSLDSPEATRYILAQVCGAVVGAVLALVTFSDAPVPSPITTVSWGAVLAELVGTTVLVLLILNAVDRDRTNWIPGLVGGWVAVQIFASSSSGLLNPAVTVARVFTDTYTGVSPSTAPLYSAAQLLGALIAVALASRLIVPKELKGS